MDTNGKFLRIRDKLAARNHPRDMWELVLEHTFLFYRDAAHLERSREAAIFLKGYEGCFVKIDALFARLAFVVEPPGFSCFAVSDNHADFFPIGKIFNIYLPLPTIAP